MARMLTRSSFLEYDQSACVRSPSAARTSSAPRRSRTRMAAIVTRWGSRCAARGTRYGQEGSGVGKVVFALFFDQQLSVPVVSQARSTRNGSGTEESAFVPFFFAVFPIVRVPSGFGSMSSAAQSDADTFRATQ